MHLNHILNPFLHAPLPTLLSHSLVQSGRAPHRAAATLLPFRSIYSIKIRRAELLKRCSIPFSCNQRANNNKPMGEWIHDQFLELNKSSLLCSLYGKKRNNAASKKNKTDQSEWPPQHTEKRGSNCSVEWSQSISSPSRAHGVENEPGDCPATTHRDKRVWTNHQLNERLNRQTSEVQMSRWRDKNKKIYRQKKPCVNV